MNAAVDALICIILVTAAIAGVLTVDQSPPTRIDRADTVANTLTTTTTTVEHSPRLEFNNLADQAISPDRHHLTRRTHGTLAGLITHATISGTRTQKAQITRIDDMFRLRVRNAVRARTGGRVRVDARWIPYPGSPLFAHFSVGPRPLSDDVHTATVSIPVGVEPLAIDTHDQFQTLGTAVAARIIAVVIPPGPARVMMRDDEPEITLTRHRYAQLQSLTNASLAEPLAIEDTSEANERLTAALAPEITSDLRDRYETPAVAVEAVSVSTVEIVIRTWDHGGGS